MKILLSALACDPGKGSELEVGFRALLAAASRHEVWVLTNSAAVPTVRRALDEYGYADRVHLEGIYFEVDDAMYPQLTAPRFTGITTAGSGRPRCAQRSSIGASISTSFIT
jgi:hypothetical protein